MVWPGVLCAGGLGSNMVFLSVVVGVAGLGLGLVGQGSVCRVVMAGAC
jgi:small-conductance mechanosensitive channel